MSLLKQLDYQIVTIRELEYANDLVIDELETFGFYDERMASVEVYLAWAGDAFGWQNYGSDGHINIPAISLARLSALVGYEKASLRDVLRHEYAHAVADTHRGLMRSRRFSTVFGRSHGSEESSKYDKSAHVTPYSAANPGEDFAEVFMKFLKHSSRIPRRFRTPAIARKWGFVKDLASAIRSGKRRW
ncbi:hypothetical protein DRQ53_13570 [bacterium]|nr:MAG: hypothetical protein DRQ53_13570 [bacterium]